MDEHIETVIVGGGQAGLSTGYFLAQQGREYAVFEAAERIGDQWRRHYESLKLYSPRRYSGLPGLAFPGEPWTFPARDEVADYLEAYALTHGLRVRTHTPVRRVSRSGDGFIVELDGGRITCDNVVAATGLAGRPAVPHEAAELSPDIVQLHSSEYRRSDQLPPGRVLVVGAAHSGTDIAYELAESHDVTLCGRDLGQLPFRPEERKAPHAAARRLRVAARPHPSDADRSEDDEGDPSRGRPMIRIHREDLDARGVTRNLSRFEAASDGLPRLSDGTVVDARSVVWATGYDLAHRWLDIPIVGDDGYPREYRGVAEDVPGLFFCGLPFQFGFGSMVFPGVGRDAEFVARKITARITERATVDSFAA